MQYVTLEWQMSASATVCTLTVSIVRSKKLWSLFSFSKPPSAAVKNIANIVGSEISVNIDIGKGDSDPALVYSGMMPHRNTLATVTALRLTKNGARRESFAPSSVT